MFKIANKQLEAAKELRKKLLNNYWLSEGGQSVIIPTFNHDQNIFNDMVIPEGAKMVRRYSFIVIEFDHQISQEDLAALGI